MYIQVLLYALCREISHIGGHNIDRFADYRKYKQILYENLLTLLTSSSSSVKRTLLRQLSQDVFLGVVGCYSDLLRCSSPTPLCVPQDCALQLLFDVRFLSLIFSHTTDDEVSADQLWYTFMEWFGT